MSSVAIDQTPIALAENLARSYVNQGGNVIDLFSAFVGVVCHRDSRVGHDCVTALDRWVMGDRGSGDAPTGEGSPLSL